MWGGEPGSQAFLPACPHLMSPPPPPPSCSYFFALTSVGLQAAYLLLVERSGAERGVGTTELLLYNALLSLPFLLLVILVTGEAGQLAEAVAAGAAALRSTSALILLLATCSLMGLLLNYSMFLCTILNSALTTTVVGVLKVRTCVCFWEGGG